MNGDRRAAGSTAQSRLDQVVDRLMWDFMRHAAHAEIGRLNFAQRFVPDEWLNRESWNCDRGWAGNSFGGKLS
jgi:hypothetical protein